MPKADGLSPRDIARMMGMPWIDLNEVEIDPDALRLVDSSIAFTYDLVPVSYNPSEKRLKIALAASGNIHTKDDLQHLLNLHVIDIVAADPEQVRTFRMKSYRTETGIFLAVGSNIDPLRNIPLALAKLQATPEVRVTASSTFYRTPPVGRSEQEDFVNGVWAIESNLNPRSLKFDILRKIETDLGRVRTSDTYAPRVIDLDLLLYGATVMEDADLTLPDPEIRERAFLAAPLAELVPDLCLPDDNQSIRRIADRLDASTMKPLSELTHYLKKEIDV